MVHFIGKRKGFYAFRLPPQSKVMLKEWKIDAWKEVNELEIWAVSKLLINGKLPMEDYLQYESESNGAGNFSLSSNYFINIDWKEKDLLSEESRTEIQFIQASALNKQRVKFR
jgi:hypothetical protein